MGWGAADLLVFEDIYVAWNSRHAAITVMHAAWSDNLQAFQLRPEFVERLVRRESRRISALRHPVVTVSEPYRDFLHTRHFAASHPGKDLEVIELGLDLRRFAHASAGPRGRSLIYCGTLEARKNVGFLLEVFREVAVRDSEATLTILGDGPERSALEHFATEHKLKVDFRGRVSHDEVLQALSRHSIYVHTSVKESFSFALLEAKLSGLWTCALASLEVPKAFIDFGFASFDTNAWAEAILRIDGQPSLLGFPDFSAERMARRTLVLSGALPLGSSRGGS
jgi:glycosyltransferase involved in cell wall biosynthesis